jgi:hypothetical protein
MNDDQLLSLLSETLADAPPGDIVESAYAAYEYRNLEMQLVQLVEDARVEVAGFEDTAYTRTLTYQADGGSIRVSIDDHSLELEAVPVPRRFGFHRPDVVVELVPDATGRVRLFDVSGSLRFTVEWEDQVAATPWMTL